MIRIFILSFMLHLALMAAPMMAREASQTAAQSGLSLERRIEAKFKAAGYEIIKNKDWREARLYEVKNPRLVILDAPYRSVYGHRARIEFLLIHGARQFLVETKRQNVSGSVDEKLAYVYLNALHNIPGREFILILEGGGFKPEALDWIRKKAQLTEGFTVLTPQTFDVWLRSLSE